MSAEMRDWRHDLKMSAARDTLAQALHYSRQVVYGGALLWSILSHEQREALRAEAQTAIEAGRPQRIKARDIIARVRARFAAPADQAQRPTLNAIVVTGLRATRRDAAVIGTIPPEVRR